MKAVATAPPIWSHGFWARVGEKCRALHSLGISLYGGSRWGGLVISKRNGLFPEKMFCIKALIIHFVYKSMVQQNCHFFFIHGVSRWNGWNLWGGVSSRGYGQQALSRRINWRSLSIVLCSICAYFMGWMKLSVRFTETCCYYNSSWCNPLWLIGLKAPAN